MTSEQIDLMRQDASKVAMILRLIGNENRLLILCSLVEGEKGVGALQNQINLSQSALSQHLAKLREDGIIAARRERQNIYYHISDDKIMSLMSALADIFCPDEIKPISPVS